MADADVLQSLSTKVTDHSFRVRTYDAYYDGELRLAAMGLSIPPEMRALTTVVNWPRLTVDALGERITLQGFRMRGSENTDDRLWSWWQRNNLDEEAPLLQLEALVQGRAFVTVGYDEDNPQVPIITCESARNMAVDIDPRTRKVRAAARFYGHDVSNTPRSATLYLPDRTVLLEDDGGRWRVTDTIDGVGQVPVVPVINRARLSDRGGRSEMADVMGITDAACRNLTNLQGAQELMALPTRYVFGITEDDMKDSEGNPVPKWAAYMGRFNTIGDENARVEQLPAADLRNFTEVLNAYARLVSSMTGMPSHYLGLTSENPASADAIRSAEARHVKRAEDKCRVFGGAWEQVMRLAMLTVDGSVPDEAERMESLFADPATPTYAAKVDAVVKLSGAGLLPKEAAWEELGYSPERIARLAQMAADDPMTQLAASVGVGTAPSRPATAGGQPGDLLNALGTSGSTPPATS